MSPNSEVKPDDKNYYQVLQVPGTNKRKVFGLLEKPNLPSSVSQATYKLYICGRPGSGKTWARSRLAGHEVCCDIGREEAVAGIETSVVYWPLKVGGKLVLFRLELWEAGDWSVRRYDHVLPACREGVSGVLLCFSVSDEPGWHELPHLLATSAEPPERATVIPLATRIGENASGWEVSPAEVHALEERCSVTVLRMPVPVACSHGHAPFAEPRVPVSGAAAHGCDVPDQGAPDEMQTIAPVLNAICFKLWQKDQEMLALSV